MVVVDTNVLAYLLIEGDRTADAQTLFDRDPDWRSEEFVLIEFSNILTTYQRSGALTTNVAETLLAAAVKTVSLITLPHERSLAIAMEFGISAYDARFLAAARYHGSRLVTEDAKLRSRLTRAYAFPSGSDRRIDEARKAEAHKQCREM